MSNRDIIRKDFEEFIRLDPSVPDELRNSLRLTERVPTFIDNLAEQFDIIDRRGIKMDRVKMKMVVGDLAKLFVNNIKVKAEEMMMSDAALATKKADIEGDPIYSKFDNDGNVDLTEEYGFVIKDKEPAKG